MDKSHINQWSAVYKYSFYLKPYDNSRRMVPVDRHFDPKPAAGRVNGNLNNASDEIVARTLTGCTSLCCFV